jgi:hypothetical protein
MLIDAKSNLARLMATENLTIEERNVPTAYFDIASRVLTVPILDGNLSPQLYDLLFGHEVGHALETPAAGWHDSVIDHKVNKSILNVCEDARIEKKIKRRFPGLKPSFVLGYKELMEKDFFGVKDEDLNELNFIDRVNLYTKGGAAQGIDFTHEEMKLLREVESTETWEEVVAIACKIQAFMQEKLEKGETVKIKVKTSKDETDKLSKEDLEAMEGLDVEFEFDDGVEAEGSKTGDIDAGEKSGKDAEGGEKENKGKGEDIDKSGQSGSMSGGKPSVESKTDNSFREREKQLYSKDKKKDIIYSNIPKIKTKDIIVSHKTLLKEIYAENKGNQWYDPAELRKNFVTFKNESNKVVSYLVKEFELRKNADQQSRAKVSKTGELNMSRIHEYKITDDLFARMTKVPNGKSHGLVMFIDWSGSMADKINATIKQLLNLVMFCKKVNIPFDVYAFTTQWSDANRTYERTYVEQKKIGDLDIAGHFNLFNLFNHKMTANEYSEMAAHLLDIGTGHRTPAKNYSLPTSMHLGGTPLNHSIIAAFELVPEFKKNNKIDIVNVVFLTDGESGIIANRISYKDAKTGTFVSTAEGRPDWKRRVVFRDPVTNATAEPRYVSGWGAQASEETTALLKLLKQRANCNLIGFYVSGIRDIRSALDLYAPGDADDFTSKRKYEIDKMMVTIRKEQTFVLENVGYDEYYFINSASLDTDDDGLIVKENATTRGLVSAFSKYTGGKINSRIILNRFIKMIA